MKRPAVLTKSIPYISKMAIGNAGMECRNSKRVPPSCPLCLFRKGKNQYKLKNYRETQDSRKSLQGRNDRSLMYGARHTRGSRHFCICGADLESWVHCVVHILILSDQIGWKEARESLRVRNPLSCRAAWQF